MKNYPVVKFVIFFIAGIVTQHLIGFSFLFLLAISLLTVVLLIILRLIKRKLNIPISILTILIIVLSGSLYTAARTINEVEYPFSKTKLTNSEVYGKIRSVSLRNDEKFSMEVEVDYLIIKGHSTKFNGLFLCNIKEKNSKVLRKVHDNIAIGNSVRINGTINKARDERNPGEFDYYKYLQSKGISATVYVGSVRKIKILDDNSNLILNAIFVARKNISEKIEELHNIQTASLLKGLLLADRSEIDYRVKENFINSGVIHVLAVSGLHVGFIVIIFLILFNRANIYVRVVLTIVGLIIFLLITNHPPSVFRATIMAAVMLLVFVSNRNYNAINSLAIAALLLLIINPIELFNPGFQLSFSAVLSILVLFPLLQQKINSLYIKSNILKYILLFSAVSFSAQLGTLPFTLIYFHKLSLVSLFANILVIPMIGVIISLGILTMIVGYISSWAALMFSSANMFFADILFWIVNVFGESKKSHLFISQFSVLDILVYYLFFGIFLFALKRFSNSAAILVVSILLTANIILYLHLDDNDLLADGRLTIMMIDIGQGDGILVEFPNGEYALIDAGNSTPTFDNGERVIAPLLKRLGIDKIDHAFVSHIDSDHYKGFLYLISNGLIKKVYKSKVDTSMAKDVAFEELIRANNVEIEYYFKKEYDFGNSRLYVLNDTTDTSYNTFDTNNKSGIIKIVHEKNTFLLVGDAEKRAEKQLLKSYGNFLDVDLLKVGHHGSKTSSSSEFIDFVKPEIALISVGLGNSFNHPSKVIIDMFNNRNIKIYRTDLEGALVFQSDGQNLKKIQWRDF